MLPRRREQQNEFIIMNDTFFAASLTSLPGRYARALFNLAQRENFIHQVKEELLSFGKMINDYDLSHKILTNPTLHRTQKIQFLDTITQGVGFSKLSQSFLRTLANAQRFKYYPQILKSYEMLIDNQENMKSVTVHAAYPLTASLKQQLAKILQKIFPGKLVVNYATNSTLLGGIAVQFGNRFIDASFANQLKGVASAMKGED